MIYAVGVGPGDPELLTRKAERILRNVDVIIAPVSNPAMDSVALETVRAFIDEERQEIVVCQFPMTSEKASLVSAWRDAATIIAERVKNGHSVAFITIGDPLFYSTFIYLFRILKEFLPEERIEIVPGISSVNAAAAQAAVPLTEGDEKMVVIPATAGISKIRAALENYETVVILKVKSAFASIIGLIRDSKMEPDTIFVERVGSSRQIVITDFKQIAAHTPDYLSLLIIKGLGK